MKIINSVLSYLIDVLVNRFQYYILALLIYSFVSSVESIFPKITFWNFLLVVLAAEAVRIISNHSKGKSKNLDTTSNWFWMSLYRHSFNAKTVKTVFR